MYDKIGSLDDLCKLKIEPPDADAMEKARVRLDAIAKPLDGLGQLEQILVRIAGIQKTADVQVQKRAILVMCADNGIVEEGVSQTSDEVTALVAANIASGRSSVNHMASVSGTDVFVTDIGIRADMDHKGIRKRKIRPGTRNFAVEPAMTEAEALAAINEGIGWVEECCAEGYRILGCGEMGIGNTTTAAAVCCALLHRTADETAGRGAGLDDLGFARKKAVIARAVERYGLYHADAMTALTAVGGLDIAGLAGIMIGGALFHVPVVLDGMITAAAALAAERLVPGVKDYLIASHMSREPSAEAMMDALGLHPVIHADMALGEGTGAAALFPLIDMALAVYRLNDSFEQMAIEAYKRCQ